MLAKLKDGCFQVRQDDNQRKSIVQHAVVRSTDSFWRVIALVKNAGRGHLVQCLRFAATAL